MQWISGLRPFHVAATMQHGNICDGLKSSSKIEGKTVKE
jgi:hypothetical protein